MVEVITIGVSYGFQEMHEASSCFIQTFLSFLVSTIVPPPGAPVHPQERAQELGHSRANTTDTPRAWTRAKGRGPMLLLQLDVQSSCGKRNAIELMIELMHHVLKTSDWSSPGRSDAPKRESWDV